MPQETLNALFDQHTTGILATSNRQGQSNAAVFGSLRLLDDGRIAVGLGNNHTLANLHENPLASLLFFTPAETVFSCQGGRIYLQAIDFLRQGQMFEEIVKDIEEKAGRMAARMITCVVVFTVTGQRSLIDMGR